MDTLSILSIGVAILACIAAVASSIVASLTYWESKSPNVIVCLEVNQDTGFLYLVVRNIGNGVAYDLSIDVGDLPLKKDFKWSLDESFIKLGIPMLAPDAERLTAIHESKEAIRDFGEKSFPTALSYFRRRERSFLPRKKIREEFLLECHSFAGALYTKSDRHQSRLALGRIATALERLSGLSRFYADSHACRLRPWTGGRDPARTGGGACA